MRRLFTLLLAVPLVTGFSAIVTRLMGQPRRDTFLHPRRRMHDLLLEGAGHGVISEDQSRIAERVLELGRKSVGDVALPWAQAITVSADATYEELRELARTTDLTRVPVVDGRRVVGVVNLLTALRQDPDAPWDLHAIMRPVVLIEPRCPLREGLERVRTSGARLAVVGLTNQTPVGLVTLRDLIEPMTGRLKGW